MSKMGQYRVKLQETLPYREGFEAYPCAVKPQYTGEDMTAYNLGWEDAQNEACAP